MYSHTLNEQYINIFFIYQYSNDSNKREKCDSVFLRSRSVIFGFRSKTDILSETGSDSHYFDSLCNYYRKNNISA